MPLSIVLTAIRHQNASLLKCTLRTGDGRLRYGEIPEYDDVLSDVKSTLRVGNTLVPFICMSDGTHLSKCGGHNTQWPVYMVNGNVCWKLRHMTSTLSVVMVALWLIPIKMHNMLPKRLEEQRRTHHEVLNEVLRQVLHPLTIQGNRSAQSRYYNVPCADANIRRCKTVLAAWLADCPEYCNLTHLE